jgi:hypothetical protein
MHVNFGRQRREAQITLDQAQELSHAARSFGAATQREAMRHPGGFGRPVVGYNPDYYERTAARTLRHAVRHDPDLKFLYGEVGVLSMQLREEVDSFELSGPSAARADKLQRVVTQIQSVLAEKDLSVTIQEPYIERGLEVSRFALRVINIGGRGLYPGLPEDMPVNTAEYWSAVEAQLQVPQLRVVA